MTLNEIALQLTLKAIEHNALNLETLVGSSNSKTDREEKLNSN